MKTTRARQAIEILKASIDDSPNRRKKSPKPKAKPKAKPKKMAKPNKTR